MKKISKLNTFLKNSNNDEILKTFFESNQMKKVELENLSILLKDFDWNKYIINHNDSKSVYIIDKSWKLIKEFKDKKWILISEFLWRKIIFWE